MAFIYMAIHLLNFHVIYLMQFLCNQASYTKTLLDPI